MESRVQQLISNNFKSKLGGSMNNLVRHISDVHIDRMITTEIIELSFDYGNEKKLFIDTQLCVASKGSRHALLTASRNFDVNGNQVRDRVVLHLPEYQSGSSYQLANIVAIADELDRGICRPCYCGLSVNHKDQTGNLNRYGYCNHRVNNLELCTTSENDKHNICCNRLNNIYNKRFSISALDKELIAVLNFGTVDEVKQYMDSIAYAGRVRVEHGVAVVE